MRAYELILIFKTSLSEGEIKKVLGSVKKLLGSLKITKENEWGKKDLASRIKKETSGYFVELLLEGEVIPVDFEKKLIANEDILRHLLIRKK